MAGNEQWALQRHNRQKIQSSETRLSKNRLDCTLLDRRSHSNIRYELNIMFLNVEIKENRQKCCCDHQDRLPGTIYVTESTGWTMC